MFKVGGQPPDVLEIAEFSNAWGSAMFIWDKMCMKLFGRPVSLFNNSDLRKLWELTRNKSDQLTDFEQLTVLSTFDNGAVRRDQMGALANAFDAFVQVHPPENQVCSLPAQAVTLRKWAEEPGVEFACWQQTSVSDNPWYADNKGEDHYSFLSRKQINKVVRWVE